MALTFPITTPDILVILPGVEVSTTDSAATGESFQTSTDDANNKTQAAGEQRGCDFTNLTEHQVALFSLIAQFRGFCDVVKKRGFATDPENWEFLLDYIETVHELLETSLALGHFDKSWLNKNNPPLPLVQLTSTEQSIGLVASFKRSANAKPNDTQIDNFSKQFSALVYSIASRRKSFPVPEDIGAIPTKVKNFYIKLVQGFTGSLVAVIRGSTYTKQSKFHYKYAKKLFEDTKTELIKLQTGQYNNLTK